jgi:hypothetical protein
MFAAGARTIHNLSTMAASGSNLPLRRKGFEVVGDISSN